MTTQALSVAGDTYREAQTGTGEHGERRERRRRRKRHWLRDRVRFVRLSRFHSGTHLGLACRPGRRRPARRQGRDQRAGRDHARARRVHDRRISGVRGHHGDDRRPRSEEEPIPVPAGYGFKLNPDSTNLEHKYDSGRLPPQQAEFAAVEVVDYYVNRLSPEWTLVSRQEPPLPLEVELRQGDTSRGISISVSVVTPQGRPAVLVLSIRTLLCGEDLPVPEPSPGGRMAAPVSNLVRYPGGGPVPVAQPSPGPLREPVPSPPATSSRLTRDLPPKTCTRTARPS